METNPATLRRHQNPGLRRSEDEIDPMLRLILLRHAKTERDSPSGKDHDRRLDQRGHGDAREIGEWLARHEAPDQVLVSGAVRARQTWDEMSALLPDAAVEVVDELYHSTPSDILQVIHGFAGRKTGRLMIVAHNPGLHELAFALAAGGDKQSLRELEDNLPTSGVVIIDFDAKTWDDVAFRGGKLVRFLSPRLLRETPERL